MKGSCVVVIWSVNFDPENIGKHICTLHIFMSVVWFDMCEKPLPARRVHDHGHALKISSYGSAAGERKCFIKSKSSNEMILRPGVVNLKIHPTWTWGEWDPHLFLPWDQTLCRAEVWPPEAIIDVPSFLPFLKLFLEKSCIGISRKYFGLLV